jgi:hypothetical protein
MVAKLAILLRPIMAYLAEAWQTLSESHSIYGGRADQAPDPHRQNQPKHKRKNGTQANS